MTGGTHLRRGLGTVAVLAATGVAAPGPLDGPLGLRLLAVVGAALMLLGLFLLGRVLSGPPRTRI